MRITGTDRDSKREQIRETIRNRQSVIEAYTSTRTGSPANTVSVLISNIGYNAAAEAIAELVNGVGEWDARVTKESRKWAESKTTAASAKDLETCGIYTPSEIHPAHIEQIARAAMDAIQ